MHTQGDMHMYICIYMFETYLHPHLHVLASSQGDMHMYAYIYMDIYIYIYTCICIHAYLFIAKTILNRRVCMYNGKRNLV